MPDFATLAPLVLILMAVGAFAGVLAGLLGVGGGIVLVPAFFYLFSGLGYGSNDLMQVCVATSLATIIVTSIRSVMAHNRKGAVDWDILKQWIAPIAIGAIIGVLVVHQLRSSTMQIIFAVMVLLIACYMMFGKSSWRISDGLPGGIFRAWFGPLMGFLSVLLGIGGG
ncbi:sulfite exporter TauE/SafE family protein, partial [Thioclava sp. UBA3469]